MFRTSRIARIAHFTRVFRALALTLTLALSAALASAKVVYVNQNAPGPAHDGKTWGTAYQTVQAGLNAAVPQDEVWVAQGTYIENIQLRNGVGLYGGFGGTETARDMRSRDAHLTILDGGQKSSVVQADKTVSQRAMIDGFTILNGKSGESERGGGIRSKDAVISVCNNIITANTSVIGAGINIEFGHDVVVSGNTITANTGGALHVSGETVVLQGNTISRNTSRFPESDTTVSINTLSGVVSNNRILHNQGRGLWIDNGVVSDCVIAGNSEAGVTFTGPGQTQSIVNCTVVGNGAGIRLYSGCENVSITNCLVAYNRELGVEWDDRTFPNIKSVSIRNNDLFGNHRGDIGEYQPNCPAEISGNMNVDPMLADPGRDFHLQPDSPCINAGIDGVTSDLTDIDGQPRVQGGHIDIGSDESDGTRWTASPRVVYRVSTLGVDTNSGLSWRNAKRTIAAAAADAYNGDEIWISEGLYETQVFIMEGVALYGGFAGTETGREDRDWTHHETIIDGASTYPIIRAPFDHSVIDGFTIRNAQSPTNSDLSIGTAITCRGYGARIANNLITNIRGNGNAVFVSDSAIVKNNSIIGNETSGIISRGWSRESLVIENNRIIENKLIALDCNTSPGRTIIRNNLIIRNGSGISCENASIVNCTIAYNKSIEDYPGYPQAMGIYSGPGVSIVNAIVAYNNAGIRTYQTAPDLTVHNSCVFSNDSRDAIGDDADIVSQTSSNRLVDPQFVNAESGDFHLKLGSPCLDAGDDSVIAQGDVDLDGLPRIRGRHVDTGVYESEALSFTLSLGAPISTSPAVYNQAVYVPTVDGKLHARLLGDGSVIPGFPLDLASALGGTVTFNSRPAVYAGLSGPAVYLTTQDGQVVKVSPEGKLLWHTRPLSGFTRSTPAVTLDGRVLVSLGWDLGLDKALNFVFSLDERTGRALSLSPYLGSATAASPTDRSPAVDGRMVYVNAMGEGRGGLVVLNRDNLTIRAQCAPGEDALAPYISGSGLYLATRSGNLYKRERTSFAPVNAFGYFGRVTFGTELTTSPFADASGALYVGTSTGRVLRVDPNSGVKRLFYDTKSGQPITGLVVERALGVVAFTCKDTLVQVPVNDPTKARTQSLDGPVVGGLVYDAASGRFVVAAQSGTIHAIPSL